MQTEKKQTVVIIQARMSSTRLPGKTLVDICGKPLLQHIIERIQYAKYIDKIVVATTENREDEKIIDLCNKLTISSFRGSENDVLDRFYKCAKEYKADIIVRITADDPFKDPEVIDKAIKEIKSDDKIDYVSNTIKPTYPEGIDVEVFTFRALEKAWKEAGKASEKEHVTPYMWQNLNIFKTKNIEYSSDISSFRWTLDTAEDLEFTKEIYKTLFVPNKIFLMNDILNLLNKEPSLAEINSGSTERFAGYKKQVMEENREANRQ